MRHLAITLSFAAATIAAPASAQFYAGIGVGGSKTSGADGSLTVLGVPVSGSGGDSTKTSWKLYGGYQFTQNWGLEAQYADLGDRTFTANLGAPINRSGTANIQANQWSIAGTGTLPIGNAFYLMAKLGATRNHIGGGNLSIAGTSFNLGGSNRTDLLAGIGAGYNFTKNIGVRFEYENFGKLSSNGGINSTAIKADNWSISLKYSF